MVDGVMQNNDLPSHVAGVEELYADGSLVVLNKPAGLLAVPGRGEDKQDCLSRRVQQHYADALIVHRLDMATSGLMLMARGADMQRALSALFESRQVHKRYFAVVHGEMRAANAGTDGWSLIDLPIHADWEERPLRVIDAALGKPSQTRWRVISFDASSNSTRVELEPVTGRSHQLRVHLKALGHPILGDALYGDAAVQARAPRLMLHASAMAFEHPQTHAQLAFESRPPFQEGSGNPSPAEGAGKSRP